MNYFLNILIIIISLFWYTTDNSLESLVALITGCTAIVGQGAYKTMIKSKILTKNSHNTTIKKQINNYFSNDSREREIKEEKQNTNMGDTFNIDQSSTKQSGGEHKPQVNIGTIPRRLEENLKSQLLTMIDRSNKVRITSVMGDGEAFAFANQIKAFLNEQKFETDGVNQAVYSEPISGQIINPAKNEIIIGTKI
jgi:hypothetical protein